MHIFLSCYVKIDHVLYNQEISSVLNTLDGMNPKKKIIKCYNLPKMNKCPEERHIK
jgi:hypothetical protein